MLYFYVTSMQYIHRKKLFRTLEKFKRPTAELVKKQRLKMEN